MDLEDRDLAALEEKLYSSIHHSYEDPKVLPDASSSPSAPARFVSKTTVINNSQAVPVSNGKRYWAATSIPRKPSPYQKSKQFPDKQSVPSEVTQQNGDEKGHNEPKKMYLAPYQSLLGNTHKHLSENGLLPQKDAPGSNNVSGEEVAQPEVKKEAPLTTSKKKQNKQPLRTVEKKLASLMKLVYKDRKENAIQILESKKTKANQVRQRKRQQHVVAQIVIDSSDDEAQTQKVQKASTTPSRPISDDETDEVVLIPASPPPQICIDCSDDEVARDTFALPKPKKGKKKKQPISVPSPRCLSPSNNSIMSDDFIGQHDRSRLNDSFTESIPNDDELECSMEGRHRPGTSNAVKQPAQIRQERVPSISSEDTVCTSGDTTDQEKRSLDDTQGLSSNPQPPLVGSGTNVGAGKSKKEESAKKKKISRSSTPVLTLSPSVSKTNTTKAANSSKASIEPATVAKTPGKPKTKGKSSSTMGLELASKLLETSGTRIGSGKSKTKDKDLSTLAKSSPLRDQPSIDSAATTKTNDPGAKTATNSLDFQKNEPVSKTGREAKLNAKKSHLALVEENVSSESDYDISIPSRKGKSVRDPESLPTNTTPLASSKRRASTYLAQKSNVSSDSENDECLSQKKKCNGKQSVAKEPKSRIGRMRKKYNSENYSDEDFACILTDIVRAVSDTEEDEEDDNDVSNINDVTIETPAPEVPEVASEKKQPAAVNRTGKKKKKPKEDPPASSSLCDTDVSPQEISVGKETTIGRKRNIAPQQPEPVKKKKKLKAAKTANELPVSNASGVSDSVSDEPKKATKHHAVRQSQTTGKKEKSTNSKASALVNEISDTDDDELQIVKTTSQVAAPQVRPDRTDSQSPQPHCAWNEEMELFYNSPWLEDDFSLSAVMDKMPTNSHHWPIVHKDRYPKPPRKEATCSNCGERGHIKFKCRSAAKPTICYICGNAGHLEPRCPHTICLNCGSKTGNFVRECRTCAREANFTCYICGGRGHTQRTCSDLWRRYHSTIEDNVPLTTEYELNPNRKWCCVCGKPGHEAHMCNTAYRIFGQPIPDVRVSSYMPAYRGEHNRYQKLQLDEQNKRIASDPTAQYNLFSNNARQCTLNLQKLAENENGFYYRFSKSSGLLERSERRSEIEMNVREPQPQEPQPQEPHPEEPQPEEPQPEEPQPEEPQLPETVVEPETVPESDVPELPPPEPMEQERATTERSPKCTEKVEEESSTDPSCHTILPEENSNYSFSELLTTEEHAELERISPVPEDVSPEPEEPKLPDFIPLTETEPPRSSSAVAPAVEEQRSGAESSMEPAQEITDNAKVYLSKENAALLLSPDGSKFLSEAEKKHDVKITITIQTVGTVMLINGKQDNQDRFHRALITFIKRSEPTNPNDQFAPDKLPRLPEKMRRYIVSHLTTLETPKHPVSRLFELYNTALKNNTRCFIWRHHLNIVLFGQYGLREGRKHMQVLREELVRCMTARHWEKELTLENRQVIGNAMRYIFSPFDHVNYTEIVEEYNLLDTARKNNKITWSEIRRTIQKRTGKSVWSPNGGSTGTPKRKPHTKNSGQTGNRKTGGEHKDTNHRATNDLILNTWDGVVDQQRLNRLDESTRSFQHGARPGPTDRSGTPNQFQYSRNPMSPNVVQPLGAMQWLSHREHVLRQEELDFLDQITANYFSRR